jgi:methionine biosynthesis protein MetW
MASNDTSRPTGNAAIHELYERKAEVYQQLGDHAGIREQLVLDLMPRRDALRVLDVGCGSGRFLRVLKQRGHQGVGVDVSESAVATARQTGVEAHVADLNTGAGFESLPAPFDVITVLDVLEHTFDPAAVLRRLTSLTHSQGSLIVSVPNIACLAGRLTLLSGRFPLRDSGLFDSSHLRWFTLANLHHYAAEGGFRMEAVTGTPLPALRGCGLWRLEGVQTAMLRRLARAWPGLWGYQLVARLVRAA